MIKVINWFANIIANILYYFFLWPLIIEKNIKGLNKNADNLLLIIQFLWWAFLFYVVFGIIL